MTVNVDPQVGYAFEGDHRAASPSTLHFFLDTRALPENPIRRENTGLDELEVGVARSEAPKRHSAHA